MTTNISSVFFESKVVRAKDNNVSIKVMDYNGNPTANTVFALDVKPLQTPPEYYPLMSSDSFFTFMNVQPDSWVIITDQFGVANFRYLISMLTNSFQINYQYPGKWGFYFTLSSIPMNVITFITDMPNAYLEITQQPIPNDDLSEQPVWSIFKVPVSYFLTF